MDDIGTFERRGEEADLRYERFFARPIETVWSALTEPARLEDWLADAYVEPHIGGRYELFINRPRPMRGRIVTWEPPKLLEYTWDTGDAPPSLVRCELTQEKAGTRLLFLHKGVGAGWIALVLPGWHSLLERLGSLLTGRIQPESMERWRELQAIYVERYRLEGMMMDPPAGHQD